MSTARLFYKMKEGFSFYSVEPILKEEVMISKTRLAPTKWSHKWSVGINARTLSAAVPRGWSRYTSNLCRALIETGKVHLYLFSDRPLHPDRLVGWDPQSYQTVVKKGWSYLQWEQWVLPRLCKTYGVQVLHCPVHYGLPMLGSFGKVLTLHDAIEVAYVDPKLTVTERLSPKRLYARGLNRFSRRWAHKVITVSEFSKKDLIAHYGMGSSQIHVTGAGVDPAWDKGTSLSRHEFMGKYQLPRPYFLYVGGLEDRKNVTTLLKAFCRLKNNSHDLVLIGGHEADFKALKNQVFSPNENSGQARLRNESAQGRALSTGEGSNGLTTDRASRVHWWGGLSDTDLTAFYAHAHCFIYPSLYEGFGLQLLEAFALDCPVLASGTTSLGEVYDFPPGQFDPRSAEELAEQMKKTIADAPFVQVLKEQGRRQKQKFSWSKVAEQTLNIYESLILSERKSH